MQALPNRSTRNQILYILKTEGPLSVAELTKQTRITNMAVRRHLQTLEKDGLIEAETVRQSMGRPTSVYRLTKTAEKMFPQNYQALLTDLLYELRQIAGEDIIHLLFQRRMHTLKKQYEVNLQGKSIQEQVSVLTKIQNDQGYMAKWEKHDDSNSERVQFQIIEHHCPIANIANQYQHACHYELKLFESLLHARVTRTACMTEGDQTCCYLIQPRQQTDTSVKN